MSDEVSAVHGDVLLPAMVLKETALENNLGVMAAYARSHGFLLAPHGKTTMAPELFRRQLDHGAWAITVANASQAGIAYGAGAARVLLANEVVGRADARRIVELLAAGHRELYCLVDSGSGVALLDEHLRSAGMTGRVEVLLEHGAPGGRAGVQSDDCASEVAEAVGASAHLRLAGVEGFEGTVGTDRSPEALAKVDDFLEAMRRITVLLADARAFTGPGPVLVSAGGSKYFDRVAEVLGTGADYGGHDVRLVVRAGCYVVHDHGTYAATSPLAGSDRPGRDLQAALEVWADVLSVPERGRAIVGMGKRDVSFDLALPVPVHIVRSGCGSVEPYADAVVTALDDQHGYLSLRTDGEGVAVGDRIGFGLSHPCTAFDRWRSIPLVDDGYIIRGRIDTFFH